MKQAGIELGCTLMFCYAIVVIESEYILKVAVMIADALTIDGISYEQWIK